VLVTGGYFGPVALAIVGGRVLEQSPLEAIVQLDHCSGTLIGADVVLTSAHCLEGPIDHALVAGQAIPVAKCERHPAYETARAAHDIGYCQLAESVPGALSLDEGQEPTVGTRVSLVGFGLSSALSREKPTPRLVTTSVVGVEEDRVEVGSANATACRGDSGGPMLVHRGDGFRVAGVIRGPKGVICGSATEVVPVRAHLDWLRHALNSSPTGFGQRHTEALVLGGLLGTALIAALAWWRRKRNLCSSRDSR